MDRGQRHGGDSAPRRCPGANGCVIRGVRRPRTLQRRAPLAILLLLLLCAGPARGALASDGYEDVSPPPRLELPGIAGIWPNPNVALLVWSMRDRPMAALLGVRLLANVPESSLAHGHAVVGYAGGRLEAGGPRGSAAARSLAPPRPRANELSRLDADDASSYARRLSTALDAVRRAERGTGATRARDLALARGLLPPLLTVHQGGVTVRADLRAIRADVAAGRLSRAAARLAALRDALAAPAAQPAAPDHQRLHALDAILSGPPFATGQSLWTAIGDFIGNLVMHSPLGGLIDAIRRLLGNAAGSNAVPVVAGLVVAAALLFVARRSFGRVVPRVAVADDASAPGARLDAEAARARAATLAAGGDFREAARYVFLATLLALDEAGKLRIDSAAGNRDLLRQARAAPRLAEALAPVVRGFELFWFGHMPITREEYERYRRLNERVLEAAR